MKPLAVPSETLLPSAMKLSELIGALSYALDITEGQPAGHCVRCCWIGMHVGRAAGLSEPQLWELYYALLLKDLGCSYQELLDELRFEQAKQMLCEDQLPIYQIAEALGFSETASFRHAFVRWSGVAPSQFRP